MSPVSVPFSKCSPSTLIRLAGVSKLFHTGVRFRWRIYPDHADYCGQKAYPEKKSVKFILHSVDGAINYGVIRLNCYRYSMNTYAICDSTDVTEIASKSRKQKPYPIMVFVQAQS